MKALKGKGILKRKRTFFQNGHKDFTKRVKKNDDTRAEVDFEEQKEIEITWTPRLTRQQFKKVVTSREDGLLQMLDGDKNPGY